MPEKDKIGYYHLLTEIMGAKDKNGDTNFKIADINKGIALMQLNTKFLGTQIKT